MKQGKIKYRIKCPSCGRVRVLKKEYMELNRDALLNGEPLEYSCPCGRSFWLLLRGGEFILGREITSEEKRGNSVILLFLSSCLLLVSLAIFVLLAHDQLHRDAAPSFSELALSLITLGFGLVSLLMGILFALLARKARNSGGAKND